MSKDNLNLDILGNSDDETVDKLAENFSAVSNSDKERLFRKSFEKYMNTKAVSENTAETTAVVKGKRPKLHMKYFSLVSALLVVIFVSIFWTVKLNPHIEDNTVSESDSSVTATTEKTSETTTNAESSVSAETSKKTETTADGSTTQTTETVTEITDNKVKSTSDNSVTKHINHSEDNITSTVQATNSNSEKVTTKHTIHTENNRTTTLRTTTANPVTSTTTSDPNEGKTHTLKTDKTSIATTTAVKTTTVTTTAVYETRYIDVDSGENVYLLWDMHNRPVCEDIVISAFPDYVFRLKNGELQIVKNGEESVIIGGWTVMVENGFITDINGDGYPEICSTYSFGSGMFYMSVEVYDVHNNESYKLSAPLWTEDGTKTLLYNLYEKDDKLYIGQIDGGFGISSATIDVTGVPVIENGELIFKVE